MSFSRRTVFSRGAVAAACALVLAACGEHGQPLTPAPAPDPVITAALRCSGDVRAGTMKCSQSDLPASARGYIIVGGQHEHVELTSSNVTYDGTQVFAFDVTVRNLTPQSMGTADGTSPHADGVRVIVAAGPSVTAGSGGVSVGNADGTGSFTASSQPFFRYAGADLGADSILTSGEASGARNWRMNVDNTVGTFAFTLYVVTEVQFPNGYVQVTPDTGTVVVGGTLALADSVRTAVGTYVNDAAVAWTTADSTVARVSAAGVVTGVGPGSTVITATSGGRTGSVSLSVLPNPVKVNEVESNGGTPGDWIELYNAGTATVDLSGYVVKDNDDTHVATLAAGTTLAPGGFLVVEESTLGYGLGAADAARLFAPGGVLVDSYAWAAHAATTYGRCPDGTGAFIPTTSPTKGAANDCRPPVKVNEVESNGGTPGDWIELYNAGTATVDLSGYVVKDNDDTHVATLAAGTTLAPGGFLVVEESALGYGLGAADAARLFTPGGALVDSYSWAAHAATTYGRCPDGSGGFATTTTSTKGAANDCSVQVKINEVESNGGTPGDWIELYNAGSAPVSLAGWVVKDNDDTHNTVLAAGTTIAAGGFLVVEESTLGYGLGAADAARLFNPGGTLVDSYSWTAHAAITYGRCPDGTGAFAASTASTKGAANACAPSGPVTSAWPGGSDVQTADGTSVFGGNLSGLTYEGGATAVLWAVRNGPGTLYRLISSGGTWTPDPANEWSAGKALRYPDGTGDPDAEGVTFAGGSAGGIYVATERNNAANGVSRNTVLRFDPAQAGAILTAVNAWDLTADLPSVGANLGIEAVTWVPDSMLVASGFYDESKSRAYAPADYPNHGAGIFFVGVEANGVIYAYALNHSTNGYTRVATIATGFPGVMGMEYDRDTGYLWATCDDGCNNTAGILEIDTAPASATRGRFLAPRRYARPTSMPNLNNEGFAFAPQSECVGGRKPVFWADDAETGGHSIRSGTLACGTVSAGLRRLRAARGGRR